ncbi:MAG: hypothetical protein PHS41_01645 [Victivallaceae bacterium]|nr:hypothetical protein [Victivallaceae bacterium]
MKKSTVSHTFDWWLVDDRLYEAVYAEYSECGCERFVLPNTHLLRLPDEPDFVARLKKLNKQYNMRFDGSHAHWGKEWAPNTVGEENRSAMLRHLETALNFSAEFETGVMVVHPGYSALELSFDPFTFKTLRLKARG